MKNLAELAKLASQGKHVQRLVKSAGVALMATTLSATTWAACSGVNLQVGYDFAFGAKTGIAALDAGTCVPNATTVNIAGNDYCSGAGGAGDYIIRTNDAGVATLKYTFTVGTVHTDYTVVVDIPQTGETGATSTRAAGLNIATFTGLPSACLTTGAPVSAISNGGRRLTCNIGTVDATNGQITVAIPASYKASARALNGETFALQSTESSAGGSTGACAAQPVAASQALTISARPKIDIKTSIWNYSPYTLGVVQGYLLDYFVYVDGLNNVTVGGEAIKSPLNFNVGLSSNVPTTGIQFLGIGDYYGATTDLLTTQAANTPAGNGVLIPVTLTPNPGAPNCAAEFLVPGGACQELPTTNPERLSTHYIRYFVPLTDFPSPAGQINFLNFINSNGSNVAGPIDTPAASTGQAGTFAEPISENSSPYTAVSTLPGSFAKYTAEFAETLTDRPAGSPGPNTAFSSMNEPVFSWCVSGACKQYPGKNVEALIQFGNRSAAPWTNTIICDKFDNRGMVLTRKPRSAGAAAHFFPTNMPGDTIVAQRTPATAGTLPSGYTVEVAIAPGTPAAGRYPSDSLRCDDGSAAWVNANSVTNYAPYNMVRVKIPVHNGPFAANSDGYAYPVFFFTVPATAPNGAYIGNQALAKTDTEFNGWTSGNFDPISNSGVYTGERFQVVKGLIRTTKDALDSSGNSTTVIGAGRTVTFKLSPSYTSAPGVSGPNANISVVDVLPSPLTYVPGSARIGSPVSTPFPPNSIVVDGQGRQVLTWSVPNVALNSAISPIFIDVAAPLTVPAGTILTNTVTVADPAVDQSTDAERSAYKAVTTDNVAGFFVTKKVSVPLIPRNGTYFNTLEIANLKSTAENNIDVIDVLPRVADPRTPPSAFSGTRFLTGPVTAVLPTVATVYYTNAVVGAAPTALNSTIGGASAAAVAGDFALPAPGPGWCLQADFGSAGCPANFAAVTGFRAKIASIPGNGVAQLNTPMGTAGNVEDDKYTNRFAMAATGFGPLFSNDVVTTVKQAKISGKVYVDLDLNSQPGTTEPPIPGVTVVLCNVATPVPCPAGNIIGTKVTDAAGAYEFTDLFPGTYFIREIQPAQYGSSGANLPGSAGGTAPSPNNFDGVSLVVGQNGINYNFGERANTLAGKVCEDLNNDGVCQAGEPPISGVVINLTGQDSLGNAITRTATTNASGDWKLSDLPNPNNAGFTLTEIQPTAFLDGKQSPGVLTPAGGADPGAAIGTTTPVVGNDVITGIKFTTSTDGTNYDFGELKPASIQGFIYLDSNQDGVRQTTEAPLLGVTVELKGTTIDGEAVTLLTTQSVGPDGSYSFANLRPGTYEVREIQPIAPVFTGNDGTTTVGSIAYTTPFTSTPGVKITDTPSSVSGQGEGVSGITLGSGGVATGYNFGEVPTNQISGIVFLDKNYDGLPAGDTGLPNGGTTTLTLCLANENPCLPANTVATTTSAPGTGAYSFPAVSPGNYFVIETQPVGYSSSSPNAVPVTMANAPVTGINFAETGAVISGTVYTDVNGSGTLDGGDVGLQGVTMRLCQDAACATVVSTTATGVNGTYTFADLPKPAPGTNYFVVQTQSTVPPALVNGTTTVGSLTAAGTGGSTTPGTPNSPASNIGPINFEPPTSVVTGAPGVVGLNYNFGEVPVSSIAGTVFYDKNADGILTPGETGVGRTTTLVLCRSAAVPCAPADIAGTTITDGNGNYVFSQVPVGSYFIQEAQPEGYGSSTPNALAVVMTGTSITNQNFGETLANVSGTVYRDNDASGTLNAGDQGLANVTVRLCTTPACGPTDGPNGGPPLTVVTSIAGVYTFADLPAPPAGKSYFIVEDQSTVLSNYPALQNGSTTAGVFAAAAGSTAVNNGVANSPASTVQAINWTPATAVSLTTAGTGTGYNFGELPTTQISGKVFIDKNFDGASNGSDSGLPGNTTVTLCRSNASPVCPPADVVATTVTTPGSGTYTFPTVTPGTYYAVETQPPGYGSSSSNTSPPIVVATTPVTGIDFAETGAYLSGTVYNDQNFNGALDSGTTDAGLPGVTVRLCTTANCTTVVATATTNPAGLYEFKDIPAPAPGQQYFIVEDQATVPATLQNGTTTVGTLTPAAGSSGGTTVAGTAVQGSSTVAGITWTPPSSVVAGTASVSGINFNFGEIEGRDVSGKVYKDKTRDGVLNPADDKPIADVVITLCRVATAPCPPTSVVGTTTTDINGDYKFTKVPQGQYFVQEAQPAGYGSSPSSPNVLPIQVAGAAVTDINFADTVSTIAGLVYRDSNNNGVKDDSELPMPAGVVITLTGTNAAGSAITKTTTTAIDGSYKFEDLLTPNGAGYTITETQPAGFGTGAANPGTLAGGTGGTLTNVISGIQLPENTDAPSYNFGDVPRTAGISGTVWIDDNKDNKLSPGEKPASGWIVQLVKPNPADPNNPIVVATSNETGSDGSYVITGVEPGAGYAVIFFGPRNPDGTRTRWGNPTNGEQGSAGPVVNAANGAATNQPSTGIVDTNKPDSLSGITLYADAIVRQQSLPLDPSGVVYDSVTRQPVPGATVTLDTSSCTGFDANAHLVGGTANLTQITGADGYYQYLLTPSAPACVYRLAVVPPVAYTPGVSTLIPPQPGAFTPPSQPPEFSPIVPKPGAPGADDPTTYYLSFNLNPLTSSNVVNNNIPLDPKSQPKLFISKVVNKPTAELGDTVLYTVKVRNSGAGPTGSIQITDRLPAGFRYILGTSMLSASTGMAMTAMQNPDGGVGSVLTYNFVTPLAPGNELTLSYRVRLGVGSAQGDGINRAQARTGAIVSNEARAKVLVEPGVFTSESCVAGKVFVDCNNNHIQDAEEVGVPGARLYLSDGTFFITDSEGKYSFCGLQPKSHVLSVDMLTMPRGSRMTTTSNRNLGDANSLFLDPKNGQLIRADFAEGSCSNTVMEQVNARRAKGEIRAPETEKKGQPAQKWEGKSPRFPQQGTNSADQILVAPRPANAGAVSVPEQNVPVPQMPAASSNTRGANTRETK